METWATFSIIDHRKPVYRQALALFDKIVVPIPPKPIGNQTQDELDQLRAEVDYLEANKAAERLDWDSDAFQDWRQPYLAEATAAKINRDIFMDTRLMGVEKVERENPGVQAVPVYQGKQQFDDSKATLMQVEQALTLEILQRLPVPDENTPLENLVHLRENPAFRTALNDLLDWKRLRIPSIVMDQNRQAAIAVAMSDFDKLTKAYAEVMEGAGFKKAKTVGSIFFSIFTGELIGAIKEGLVECREMREPCWKKVSEMKCAPGGVIYHFKKAIE
jgi:hypothetical protein